MIQWSWKKNLICYWKKKKCSLRKEGLTSSKSKSRKGSRWPGINTYYWRSLGVLKPVVTCLIICTWRQLWATIFLITLINLITSIQLRMYWVLGLTGDACPALQWAQGGWTDTTWVFKEETPVWAFKGREGNLTASGKQVGSLWPTGVWRGRLMQHLLRKSCKAASAGCLLHWWHHHDLSLHTTSWPQIYHWPHFLGEKLLHRNVKELAEGHTDGRWWSWDLNPNISGSRV